VHIDDFVHHFELPFHTKLRKARKKKTSQQADKEPRNDINSEDSQDDIADDAMEEIKVAEAEEEDQGEDLNSSNSPISWIRLDPEMEWFCSTDVQQPDFMWIEQLENDRDVGAQHEAAIRLQRYASDAACECFEKLTNDWKVFYKVRIDCLYGLASV
jgi:transcription initiation factor TFIID subunit 2